MIVGETPQELVLATFVPTTTFIWGKNQYVKDMCYYIREGNDSLMLVARVWAKQGMIHMETEDT